MPSKGQTVQITEKVLEDLWRAQMEHTRNTINHSLEYFSDDGYDYLCSALNLCEVLSDLYYESDYERLGFLLNTPSVIATDDHYLKWELFQANNGFPMLETYASDGVCLELYTLNCPALPKEL